MGAPKGNQYAKGNDGGRPPIYTEEWLENEAKELLKWMEAQEMPYLRGWAARRGYSPQRISEFRKKSAVFAEALDKAHILQEEKFLLMGLTKEWDASTVRYAMARICDPIWKSCYEKDDSKESANLELVKALAEVMGKSTGIGECKS